MNKKKVIALVLCIIFAIGTISVSAEDVKTENNKEDYLTYSSDIQSSSFSTNEIVVDCAKAMLNKGVKIAFEFDCVEDAYYSIGFVYTTVSNNTGNIEIDIQFDGNTAFSEMSGIRLKRYYKDIGGIRFDAQGNEVQADVEECIGTYKYILEDDNNAGECLINIAEGRHSISLECTNGSVIIEQIILGVPSNPIKYEDYINTNYPDYAGEQIVLEAEGESLHLKSSEKIVGMSDNSSVEVSPVWDNIDKINYTGGTNWSQPGNSLIWKIKVKKTGYYNLAVNYRQHHTQNTTFYRKLLINGEVPFEEANYITFPYARNWTTMAFGNGDLEYKFYFEADKEYEIELSVTLGPISEICDELDDVTTEIASLYRDIIMITGDTIDNNRDYSLFTHVENWDERLERSISSLYHISDRMVAITGDSGSSTLSTVNNLVYVLEQMRDNKYSAHKKVGDMYSYYGSLCSLLSELRTMPLDIDRIILKEPMSEITGIKAGFFEKLIFGINKFFNSFVNDYNSTSQENENREELTLWVNWGRDQAKVLKFLIQSDFSSKYDVDVDIKITNATLTHAALSGNGPDVMLNMSRSEPVNLAMRDALYDLTNFDGKGDVSHLPCYTDVLKNFADGADVSYWFEKDGHNGLYALPDTQTFFMMFVRDDIFKELGLEVPKTWDEFDETAISLLRNNMMVGLPYTQITAMEQVNVGAGALSIFPTLMVQANESFYTDDYSATDMLDKTTINIFNKWTDYYLRYGFAKSYDFFNRFKVGVMPMAIQPYQNYATLSAAAPEISGKWSMYEIPGALLEDGSIDNRAAGGGTGAAILADSKNKEAAWEFICWWTSADAQYEFCSEVEAILGPSARVATSNVEALKKFEWSGDNLDTLLGQWSKIEEIPEVPGGYSIARIIDQAFWNVVNNGEDSQDMLIKWTKIADNIIERRRSQYGIDVEEN